MNKILLSGRLTRDAELGYNTGTGTPKASFSLAVERAYQKDKHNKKVDFINCEMIGKHTENLCQYLTKGKALMVEGELNIDNYEKAGEFRSFTKVKVDKVEFQAGGQKFEEATVNGQFQELATDDIPF